MRTISKPHATWKPELSTNEREETWKFAAGSDKSLKQHQYARNYFTRTANENAAEAKNGVGLNTEDSAVLKKKQERLSKKMFECRAWLEKPGNREKNNTEKRAWREKPGNREKQITNIHAWLEKPGNREKQKTDKRAWKEKNSVKQRALISAKIKAKTHALQIKRMAESKANGTGRTTDFGLGFVSRADELECAAYDIMNNPAGVLCPKGEATTSNWIRDHGEKSIYEVASSGNWAVYVLTTKQDITSGIEIKCSETTKFMSCCRRSPLMRIDTVDKGNQRDFRRFTVKEAKTVVRSYILAKCVSAYDATGLEGSLQRYIEKEMGMSHGLCLHQKAGAAPKLEYGSTNPETTWVAVSLIRLTSPTFADVDHVDPNRSPPLLTCTITSHDGKITYNVGVRGDKQKFPCTKSVVADEAKKAASRLHTSTRRKKRKADAMSRHEDTLSVQ